MINSIKLLSILSLSSSGPLLITDNYINYDEISLKSDNYENKKWIYVDSRNEKAIGEDFQKDYGTNYSKANKWEDYNYSTTLLTIDTTKYTRNSSDFQNKYRSFVLNFETRYNLFDSKNGWSKEGDKLSEFNSYSKNSNIIYDGNYINLFEEYSNTHKAKVKVDINFKINDEKIIIGVKYTGIVWWKGGSVYKHAAIVSTWHENIIFSERVL
ncbi:hypothetical protein [Spiroplasma endosymbiont of Diplazon laetatorius]|uniref:hypothetical protein n=1 Tax=Spiroplasma endosymbiont of Diplazon laetatorius TaxID=3066322 RepID=UPI0030D28E7C